MGSLVVSYPACQRWQAGIMAVSDGVLTDALWQRLQSLIPPRPRRFRYPGRRAVDDRVVLAGIVWVLRHDVPWRQLPASCGVSGVTCWRRLRDWQTAGVWQQLHETLLAELHAAGRLDLHAALVDSSHVHALKGGSTSARPQSTEPIPVQSII
jgi:transposase